MHLRQGTRSLTPVGSRSHPRPRSQGTPSRRCRDILRDPREVDLANKSEEFLSVTHTGKAPVIAVDGEAIYESSVVNRYLVEVPDEPKLMPADPGRRVNARIWMASADTDFFPAVFAASVGRERRFSKERISEAPEKPNTTLQKLEERPEERDQLADGFTLADVAYAGNIVRPRELEERGEVSIEEYPNVAAWMERLEGRDGCEAAV